ncbi:hypothetical protein SDC9_94356 [bioreactor metagenome]|uniref:SLH domain-containing protein n=1 Tax=bioreactor metagenome TaxID=1076179 RepID=A0A645A385_9ZZZZ
MHVLGGNTILSGTIIATGGSASSSYGVRSESGTISVTSGRVTATGGTADNTSSGVFSNSRVNVSGGTVTASSGAAGNFSQAMNRAPIYAANCGIIASTNTDGSSAAASYDVSSITSYKYLKIGNLYPLTVNLNGGSGTTANGVHMAGDNVSINAGAKSGYTFSGWTSTGGGTFASAANTSTIYTMPAGAAAITANWTLVYTLTVNLNGGSGATINGIYKAGDVVSIDAGAKSGYTFSGWTSTGGTFASAANTSTTFTMPAGAAVITASWAANSSGNSSGNSSSGSSSSGTLTVPVSSDADKINVSASVSGNTATIKVTDTQLKEIISRTEAGTVKIDMSGLKVDTVAIPAAVISAAGGASGSTSLAVALPTGTVTLDKTALASIAGKGDIKFSVETVANKNLTDSQRKVLGTQADSAVVVDVNVFVNGTQTSTFRDGKITVSVPYMSKSGENIDSITVWFIKDDGTIESKNGVYNAATGYVEFTTVHLSRYLIVNFPFADVAENSWYYGSVAYAYNNGLFVGTSDTTFSPDSAMTRQMIWMTLARMDSKTPADMEAARDWAMKNGISDGTNPANSITRQQMAIILYRFAQYKGYDTTQGGMVIRKFTDYDSISEYALPALSWAVNAGLMQGNSNNLMHAGSATRAQVATILQRFCQSVAR